MKKRLWEYRENNVFAHPPYSHPNIPGLRPSVFRNRYYPESESRCTVYALEDSMTTTRIDDGAFDCQDNDKRFLGFPTGLGSRRFSRADTVSIRKSGGFITDGITVRDWPIENIVEADGEMIALGPWLEGSRPLDDGVMDAPLMKKMLHAARILVERGCPMKGFYSRAFRRLPDGNLLVFPPKLACWVREAAPETQKAPETRLHPDLREADSWSFTLGVMLWNSLCAADPFAGDSNETGEDMRERMRRGIIPPPEAVLPELEPEPSEFLKKSLTSPQGELPSLTEWDGMLRQWEKGTLLRQLTEEEKNRIRESAQKKARRTEKTLRSRRWFRKSGWKVLVGVAALGTAALFLSGPVSKALETPVTAGMPPLEVAATYYDAVSRLDSETMDQCLARKVGKDDQRQVDMIYVTHKIRQGYEGLGNLPSASEWLAQGRPELPEGIWPWGVVNLELQALPDGRIQARYELWSPAEGSEDGEPASIKGQSREDILTFTQGRRSWEISGIDRTYGRVIE